jgi:hypothetical protein
LCVVHSPKQSTDGANNQLEPDSAQEWPNLEPLGSGLLGGEVWFVTFELTSIYRRGAVKHNLCEIELEGVGILNVKEAKRDGEFGAGVERDSGDGVGGVSNIGQDGVTAQDLVLESVLMHLDQNKVFLEKEVVTKYDRLENAKMFLWYNYNCSILC